MTDILKLGGDDPGIKKPEIETVQQEKKEFKHMQTFSRRRGHMLFEYNPISGKLIKCDIVYEKTITLALDDKNYLRKKKKGEHQKAYSSKGNIYFEALNMPSAIRRVDKYKKGFVKELFNLKQYKPTIKLF